MQKKKGHFYKKVYKIKKLHKSFSDSPEVKLRHYVNFWAFQGKYSGKMGLKIQNFDMTHKI